MGAGGGRDVGLVAVVVTTGLAATLGAVSRRLLTRRPGGDRRWLVLAGLTLLVSLAGPLGAASVAAGLALASLHLVVAVVVVVGLTRLDVVRRPVPAAQA